MKIMKKYVAIAAAAILLAGVVYFSCSLNKGKKPVNADADAMPLKAPASRKMKIMINILSSPIPEAQMRIFSSKDTERFWNRATAIAAMKATTTDMT